MILDTTFLVDVLRGDDAVVDLEREVDERGTGRVVAVSVMELIEGARLSDATADERDRVRDLLDGLHRVPFDAESAAVAGEISADLTLAGTPIDVEDVMIGSVALTRDEPVVTRNADHFDRIDGLDVRTY